MINKNNLTLYAERWLALFVSLHVMVWTLTPYLMRHTLPVDAMEGAIWGQHLLWGYDKDPFLNGWLSALAIRLSGTAGWGVYLFSQLSVAICFLATWELAKKILPPLSALLSILFLEGVQYYNLHALDFDDNTLELATWALCSLFFYKALREDNKYYWLYTGIFAGLALMAKYYSIMLLIPMLLFMFATRVGRQHLLTWRFAAGVVAMLVVIAPHCYWLATHDFVTLDYCFQRLENNLFVHKHFHYAAVFAWQQIAVFIPTLLLMALLFIGKKPLVNHTAISRFDKQFLFTLGFAPLFLTLLLSVITGAKLRAGWGEPLLSLWGIILFAYLPPHLTTARFYRGLGSVSILMLATVSGYIWVLQHSKQPSSANFPGAIIARTLTQEWHATQHTPLTYVVGPRWLAGNIAFYSADHPDVYLDCNPKANSELNKKNITVNGAIFVWDNSAESVEIHKQMQQQFGKALTKSREMHFSWLQKTGLKPVIINVAYLPPAPR